MKNHENNNYFPFKFVIWFFFCPIWKSYGSWKKSTSPHTPGRNPTLPPQSPAAKRIYPPPSLHHWHPMPKYGEGYQILPAEIAVGIRAHHPKSGLGDKILAIREGDYKNCFREGEGRHLLGYGKDAGKIFLSPDFFYKNIDGSNFWLFSLFFFKNPQNVSCFCCIREGGALGNFLSPLLGRGQKLP